MRQLQENTEKYKLGRILDRSETTRITEVVNAWKKSGYLYGLKGRDLGKMAILAENQKKQILAENNTSADMAVFDTIAIPMIRRQNALMVTPNLISVQPLSYSNGVVFYLDYEVTTGANAKSSVGTAKDYETTSGYDRFYDNKGYDTSKGRVIARGYTDASTVAAADAALTANFQISNVDLGATNVMNIAVVDFNATAVGGFTMNNLASLRVFAGSLVEGQDYFVQKTIQAWGEDFLSSGRTQGVTSSGNATGQNQPPTTTGGGIQGPGAPNNHVLLKIIPAKTGLGTVQVRIGFNDYANLELEPQNSSELKMKVTSAPIQTHIHKLKTAWTIELAQDLMAYHAIDAEAELTQLMSEETAQEKDRMIIKELVIGAAHFEVWNANFATAIDPNPANTVFRGTEGNYNQTLVYAVNRINGKIQKSTRRGGANWVLISAEGAAKLENLETYKPMEGDQEGTKFAAGVERIGKLSKKWDVYVDPILPAEVCLVGRKGTSFFDTGYVYCPYIEYILSPVVIDPETFNPRRQLASRFGTKMLNNKFYGIVQMKGIEKFEVFN